MKNRIYGSNNPLQPVIRHFVIKWTSAVALDCASAYLFNSTNCNTGANSCNKKSSFTLYIITVEKFIFESYVKADWFAHALHPRCKVFVVVVVVKMNWCCNIAKVCMVWLHQSQSQPKCNFVITHIFFFFNSDIHLEMFVSAYQSRLLIFNHKKGVFT